MKTTYTIKQFEDKSLSHYSYAILDNGEIILIDPARNPQPYYDFAEQEKAIITGVIETHPHADFVSSHLEIHNTTGAAIYVSKLLGAEYPHKTFDEGDTIQLGNLKLKALNTPGHSPDSICVVLECNHQDLAVFTGDTLFIGDCGRPDLRENVGNIQAMRTDLAKNMFYSLRDKLLNLNDTVLLYPAHGAGTLCGKGLSEANFSTIGAEKLSNWSLKQSTENAFISKLITDQPFIPKYFSFDVTTNKKGATPFLSSINNVTRLENITCENSVNKLQSDVIIIDTRSQKKFRKGHFPNSINLQIGGKFETWLGSIIEPNESFYLAVETEAELGDLIERIAKIGYEAQIKGAFAVDPCLTKETTLNIDHFTIHPTAYTIIDIRNDSEVKEKQIFKNSINIPLPELRERTHEIPLDKPIIVHCAGGYRSAAGSSILESILTNGTVYDLSDNINNF